MAWNNSVVTNEGLAMLSDVLNGGTVTISAAAMGEGTVDVSALMVQTELTQKNEAVTVDIADESNLKDGIGKAIRLQVRNTGLTAAATARQFGIYAESDDGSTVLLAIMQDETGEEIPSETEYPDFMLEFTAAIALSQTDGIKVTVSGSAVITAETLNDTLRNYAAISEVPSLSWSRREQIPANADLDTYVEAGSFIILDASVAATLGHAPNVNTGGWFDVYHRTETTLYQRFTSWAGISVIRYCSGGIWSDWISESYHPNILINSDFSINQRGQTEYTLTGTGVTHATMTVDCWKLYAGSAVTSGQVTVSITDEGLVINNQTDGAIQFYQKVEDYHKYFGDIMSMSLNANGETSNVYGTVENTTGYATARSMSWGSFGIYVTQNSLLEAIILLSARSAVTLRWVKLEVGTPTFYIPPDPATELAKCQRYLYVIKGDSLVTTPSFRTDDAAFLDFCITTPVTMRINNPTVSFSGLCLAEVANGNNYFTDISKIEIRRYADSIMKIQVFLDTNTIAANILYALNAIPSTASEHYLMFSAEL